MMKESEAAPPVVSPHVVTVFTVKAGGRVEHDCWKWEKEGDAWA